MDKLRQTRDTLNDILTENDQLKIEVIFDTFFVRVLLDSCYFFVSPMVACPLV